MKKTLVFLLILFFLSSSFTLESSAYTFGKNETDMASFEQALSVFHTCAFSAEYGNSGRDFLVRWETPIRIYVSGSPTRQDIKTLDDFIKTLKANVPLLPGISRVINKSKANIVIHFCRLSETASLVPDYTSGNWGYFHYEYKSCKIYTAVIGIATDVTNQQERKHLRPEALVGALGLANDHWDDPASILYQGWTTVQSLSALDWTMLNFLYSPVTKPGDKWDTVERALRDADH